MATITVSLPDQITDWVEAQVIKGEYASASAYVHELIRRDQGRQELTPDELRKKIAVSKDSGLSPRRVEDIFAEAQEIARARGLLHG